MSIALLFSNRYNYTNAFPVIEGIIINILVSVRLPTVKKYPGDKVVRSITRIYLFKNISIHRRVIRFPLNTRFAYLFTSTIIRVSCAKFNIVKTPLTSVIFFIIQ
jgi:hypothetical protein